MARPLRLLALIALSAARTSAFAQAPAAEQPSAPAAAEWKSMSRARVAVPLPAASQTAELTSRTPPPKWSEVPLPPPPSLKPASAPLASKTAAVAEAPAGDGAAALPDGSKEPKTMVAADATGVMVSVTQDLDSDRIRQSWAGAGGTIPAFEANGGMTLLYKDMSQVAGAGSYMSGVGFNFGGRVALLTLTPPKYETRDRNWFAFKVGGGVDMGVLAITINTPELYIGGKKIAGGMQSASMTSFTLVGTVGFMYAFGSFDSPSDWSGFAVGAEWAPSQQSNTLTDQAGNTTNSSSFNATAFALNFESGSLRAMASKMGKKARLKVRLFFLPPVGEMPFMMTASLGAVWY